MKSVKEILDDLEKKSKEKMFIDRIMWCVKPTKTIPSRYVSREEFERLLSLSGKMD